MGPGKLRDESLTQRHRSVTASASLALSKTTQDDKHVFGSHFLNCLMSAFTCLPSKINLDTRLDGELFVFAACATPFSTTFAIFNMVPVYLGLGSSYGFRV